MSDCTLSKKPPEHNSTQLSNEYIKFFTYLFLFGLSLILVALLFVEVRWVDTSRGWFLQPRFASALGLGIFSFFSLVKVVDLYRPRVWSLVFKPSAVVNFMEGYRTAVMSSALFVLYVFGLSIFGFAPSSLVFLLTLLWMSRLLNRQWLLITIFTVFILVLIFRVGVSLWIPEVWLYEFLPVRWADFANKYL